MKKLFLLITAVIVLHFSQAQVKVLLSKKEIIVSGKIETEEYKYDSLGRIQSINKLYNGKLSNTITDFVFNGKGFLLSYNIKPSLKTFPTRVKIGYDDSNRIKQFETTGGSGIISKSCKTYSYSGDTIRLTQSIPKGQETIFVMDAKKNIIKKQGLSNGKVTNTILYSKYDLSKNPQTLTGGFVDSVPQSKDNFGEETSGSQDLVKIKNEYEKILVSKYQQGGAKIPTQYKNGLLRTSTEIMVDNESLAETIISITTYQYIKL